MYEITKNRDVHRVSNINGNAIASQTFFPFKKKNVVGKTESQNRSVDVGGNSKHLAHYCILINS